MINWPTKKLGEICEIIPGQAPPSEFYNTKKLGKPFLKVSSFGEIYPKIDTWTTKSLRESREGDVLFSVAGSLGMVNLGINACITRSIFALRPNTKLVLQKFLFYSLKFFGKAIANSGAGTAQKIITISQLSNFQIPLPPLSIQQKIVSILDTIQSAIDLQNKIIETTKELKKSLMADLFKYGAPSFRKGRKLKKTEIGEIPENWEVVRLGEVVDVKGGKRLPKGHKFSKEKTSYPYLRVVNFKNSSINEENLMYLTKEDFQLLKNYFILSEDVYISIAGTIGLVGTVPNHLSGAILTENAAKLIIINKAEINKNFLVIFLSSDKGQYQIRRLIGKSTQPKLALFRIKQIYFPLPPLPEQREIADILQTIDQKIEIEQKKKALYEELFKTMLNKLMNGEIDVEKIEI